MSATTWQAKGTKATVVELAPWRSPLARALHRNRSRVYSRYAQLATIGAEGCPANRTVVFRGFPPDRNALLFVTDVRSEKVSQLQVNPMAELCWYFTQTREQFRIAGEISVITAACGSPEATNLRQHLWEGLSAQARHQFTWPPPGRPHANSESKPMPTDPGHSLDTFAVLLLDPDRVDHLELRGNPQNRTRYDRVSTANWQMQAINP